jgi:hypothetical protein
MEKELYLGCDLNRKYAQISCYQPGRAEPETISIYEEEEKYVIPLIVARHVMGGAWYFGDDALRLRTSPNVVYADDLLERALKEETVVLGTEPYEASDLLALFLQKLLELAMKQYESEKIARLVIATLKTDEATVRLLGHIFELLNMTAERVSVIDYRESFFYYALRQPVQLRQHDIQLYELNNDNLTHMQLTVNHHTIPKTVMIRRNTVSRFRERDLDGTRVSPDEAFLELVTRDFASGMYSAAYLIGEGFENEGMKQSLNFLCSRTRVFRGRNLYTKGAAYAAMKCPPDWNYVFLGDSKTKTNVCMVVNDHQKKQLITLVSAGENWYETSGEYEILLCGPPQVNILLKSPDNLSMREEILKLRDLPNRPPGTTRLKITARPQAQDVILITIEDLGFGELFVSEGRTWSFRITV